MGIAAGNHKVGDLERHNQIVNTPEKDEINDGDNSFCEQDVDKKE